jgi:multiple sugar transport system ATP-binding protein
MVSDGEGLPVTVEVVEELGSDAYLFASLPGHDDVRELGDLIARIDPRHIPRKGSTVTIKIRPDEIHLVSPSTGERLV